MLEFLKNKWIWSVNVYNKTIIFCLLAIIFFFVLTPIAVIRRFLLKIFISKKTKNSYLIKSPTPSFNHFKDPF